ncbi:L-threonine aldolase [Chromohalobacter marismortui]|uniref:L-threonine aldolase n=1 Tax=Chromohalobacter marismortui TaxID=42055 RepID=A0A4R7NSS4_9GAMM|nr:MULTISPECIES: low specificity L-threonine aldolase [Chromohalobacter]MCI0509365.1 low specificity L-threonine aldolase [Chromohalobacter sp.]MCI0594214.1 low specificity L-threonine aldolase [Chromohalobacter sp.]TDU23742.1 L-threonine aldolase [Chromohalobacter marismortui]
MESDCTPRFLASDNTSGICPEALDYLLRANASDDLAYGNDAWTQKAADRFRRFFDYDCDVFFVFNGTAANSLTLASMGQSYHSVICHELAHIETDECGGPEFFSNGAKLLTCSGADGKLTPEGIESLVTRRSDIHYPKPRTISLTQATEVGTVYTRDELMAIRAMADKHGLHVHMDGARFANACASLEATPAELTWQVGVDALCFSGTKNGLPMGEAVVFFNSALAEDFDYRCKQAGQLASKMRFITAPWLGMLESGAWLRNAEHANAMARYLAEGFAAMPGAELMFPAQANSVFVTLPVAVLDALRQRDWTFYTFIGAGGARFVCAWNTTQALLDQLLDDVRDALSAA